MHAYCISLEQRDDRRRSAGAEFEREGLPVEFFPATDGRVDTPPGLYVNPAEYGCSMSHTRVWRDMVEKEYPAALVFEDDVRLVPNFVSKLIEVLNDAEGIPWDIIHLGPLLPIAKEKGVLQTLYEGQGLGTHAYLISLECAKKIAPFDAELMKVSVDFQLNRFPLRLFCVGEPLAKQESVDDELLVGLVKSAVKGDIGLERTFDLNYLLRFFAERFKPFLVLLVSLIILVLSRN
jgi:hypothetical protein